MPLEKRDATQLVTFSPAPPRYAWPVYQGGTTNTKQTWAGAGQAGTLYAFAQVNTTAWALQPGGNQPALQVGDQFQLWTTQGHGGKTFPSLQSSTGAPDLFKVSNLVANDGTFPTVSLKESTVFTVQGMTSNTTPGGTTSTLFFTPIPTSGNPATTDGVVSLPQPQNPRWLGAVGHVHGLNYTWTYPGGPSAMTFELAVPPDFRTDALNPGRVIQAYRGASCIWEGILTEPTPAATGWSVTATGAAQNGTNFAAYYQKSWSSDEPVNLAINRGLRWNNSGIGNPSGIYLGPVQDTGSITVNDFLNLLCTGGSLVWNVTQPAVSALPAPAWSLQVSNLPVNANGTLTRAADLVLASNAPVTRTVNNLINTLAIRYQATADVAATKTTKAQVASYSTIFVDVPQLVQKYGRIEYYLDASTAGQNNAGNSSPAPITQAQAVAIGQNVLTKYIRANWSGTFTVNPGMLMNAGGQPVDLGVNIAGKIVKLAVNDAPYGGEVSMAPIQFLVGTYQYDEDTVTATVTPYQAVGTDIGSLINMLYPGRFA